MFWSWGKHQARNQQVRQHRLVKIVAQLEPRIGFSIQKSLNLKCQVSETRRKKWILRRSPQAKNWPENSIPSQKSAAANSW